MVMLHLLARRRTAAELQQGSDRDRSRHRLRRRRHRPRHRHRPRGRQRHHRDGPPARVGRHGPHHDVPRHRVHRGARALRLRPRLHHLGLKRRNACVLASRAVIAVARHRGRRCSSSPRRRSRRTATSRSSPTRRPRSASRTSRTASTVDDCQKAPIAAPARRTTRSSGASLAFVVLLGRHVEVRRARRSRTWRRHARTASATTSTRPRRPRPRPRPSWREYQRAARRRRRTRPAASSRRPGSRPSRCARDLIARAEAEAAEIRRAGRRPTSTASERRRWPTCGPRSPSCRSSWPSRSSSATSTATRRPQLVDSFIDQVGSN